MDKGICKLHISLSLVYIFGL